MPLRILPDPLPRLLTVPEVAQHLRLSRRSIYLLVSRGALPAVRVGTRGVRIPESDVVAYLLRGRERAS